jgi:hypothetical protein
MNEITTTQSFQERMFEKIRDQMGDLLTDEDLQKLVSTAMQKAFFEPRIDSSSYNRFERPPYFVELIEKQMREAVAKAASQWVVDNPELVSKAITEALEKGVFGMALSYFESKALTPLMMLQSQLQQKGVLN